MREASQENEEMYEEIKLLSDDEVKRQSAEEELKLRLLEQQCSSMQSTDDAKKLEDQKERLAQQNDQLMEEIKDMLPLICDKLLQLRLFLVESEGDSELIRFGANVRQMLQKMNDCKPNLNRVISELLVRNSRDSDVKIVQMAKSMYSRKLMQMLEQLQAIQQICNDSVEFLRTKLYGGFLIRKTVNEMNAIANEIENQSSDSMENASNNSVDKSEFEIVKEMLKFDFNGGLTKLKVMLNDQLKQFDNTIEDLM